MALLALPRPRRQLALDSPTLHVLLAGLTSVVVIVGLQVAPLPIWAGPGPQPAAPPATRQPIGWDAALLELVVILGMLLPFRPYSAALRVLRKRTIAPVLLISVTAAVALAAFLAYPGFSSDIFGYAGYERMWVVYGENPLLTIPNHPNDWAAAFFGDQPDRPIPYGPLWPILTWPVVRLAGESTVGLLLGYKLLTAACYVMCSVLIWSTVEPNRRQRALVAFAWSPVVLFTALGKVHNDIFPALGALFMLWLFQKGRGRQRLSLAAAVAGGLVKATGLAVAPAVALALWRRGARREFLPAATLGLMLAALAYAPFWGGPQTLQPLFLQASRLVWSPATLLIEASSWLPGGPYQSAVRVLLIVLCALACALLLRGARGQRTADVAATSGWLLLLTMLLLTSAVYGQYFVPLIAVTAVAGDARLDRFVYWLSVGGLAAYGVDLLGLVLNPSWLGSAAYATIGSVVLLAPTIMLLRAPEPDEPEGDACQQYARAGQVQG